MHRIIHSLILVIVLSAALVAGPKFYVNTGISKPFAPESFLRNWRSGYEIGGGVGWMLKDNIEIIPGLHYNNFAMNDASFLDDFIGDDAVYSSVSGGTTHIIDIGADIKWLVPAKSISKVTPYVTGGLGYALYNVGEKEIITSAQTFTEEKQTAHKSWVGAGLGFEILMGGNTYFFLEGRFNLLFADESTVFAPLKFGIIIK